MRFAVICAALAFVACADMRTPSSPSSAVFQSSAFAVGSEGAPPVVFNAMLRAESEPNNASTSESKGNAQVKVLPDGTIEFQFTINNTSADTYTRAHIHKAPAGSNGPIHWDFLEAGVPVGSISDQPSQLRGVARPRTAAVIADLLANPDQYYVNVHSTAFPGGAIRGQLK